MKAIGTIIDLFRDADQNTLISNLTAILDDYGEKVFALAFFVVVVVVVIAETVDSFRMRLAYCISTRVSVRPSIRPSVPYLSELHVDYSLTVDLISTLQFQISS